MYAELDRRIACDQQLFHRPLASMLGGTSSATSNLSIAPSSTPLPSHRPHGNLCSKYLSVSQWNIISQHGNVLPIHIH